MRYQVLARKYRPKQFGDLVGQSHVVQALTNALTHGNLHHAYLFTGTRGSGKTTLARLLAKCLNCETGITATPCEQCDACQAFDRGCFPDFYEVDAASRTKVEDTRELLDNVPYAPAQGRFKIYLIDEVHMLSGHSFNALLKTLEEPPAHVKFLLATTDYQKLPATVLSRCLQFHLHPIAPDLIATHLADVLTREQLPFETEGLQLLATAARGSLRDALSLLDQAIAYGNQRVMTADVATLLGTVDTGLLLDILDALQQKQAPRLLEHIRHLEQQGVNFSSALGELLRLLHRVSVYQLVPTLEATANEQALQQLAARFTPEDVQLCYQIGLIGQRDFAYAPSPSIAFEMTLLRMLAFYPASVDAPKARTPITATSAAAPATPAPAAPSKASSDWLSIVSQLKVSGAALALIQNCSLESMTESQVTLLIKPSQKALAQATQIQRVQHALTEHFQRPVTVSVRTEAHERPTPAELGKQQQQQRQQTAKQELIKDEKLQQLMQTFDATLIENSITTDNSTNH